MVFFLTETILISHQRLVILYKTNDPHGLLVLW